MLCCVLCCCLVLCYVVLCCVVVLCRYVVLCYVALSCVVLYCWIGWLSSVSLVSLIWFALAGYSHTGTAVQCCIEIVIFLHACCTGTRQWSQLQACDRVDTDTSIEHRKTSGLFLLLKTRRSPHYLLRFWLVAFRTSLPVVAQTLHNK